MIEPFDAEPFDLLTMGRIGVDICPLQVGVSLRGHSFGKYLAGSPTNAAVGVARYGRRRMVITRTGADPGVSEKAPPKPLRCGPSVS